MPRATPLPFDGLLIADFSRVLAGPLCTQLLADAGARVIKIEEPGRGDETRRWGPPFVHGISSYFLSVNRNKESLTLNLKSEAGREAAGRLIERADVVVENFLPSQKRALHMTWKNTSGINPRIVHCAISGYDSQSADADVPGYDLLAQASSGLMSITGVREGEPMKAGVALSDVLTAHHAHGAIGAALFARERTGRGSLVEVNLFGSTLASLVNVAQAALLTGKEALRYGNEHASIVPYQLFHARDRDFVLGAGTDRHFTMLCELVIGRPDLATDPRFRDNFTRVQNREVLIALLTEVFEAGTARKWVGACRKQSIPAALVQGVKEALHSPLGQQLVISIDHEVVGEYQAVGSPVKLQGRRRAHNSPPPALGEHTDRVLRELGYSKRNVAAMRDKGIV